MKALLHEGIAGAGMSAGIVHCCMKALLYMKASLEQAGLEGASWWPSKCIYFALRLSSAHRSENTTSYMYLANPASVSQLPSTGAGLRGIAY
eukprot:scaffold170515_cov21-Tisochrysis_lutea.AAC.1